MRPMSTHSGDHLVLWSCCPLTQGMYFPVYLRAHFPLPHDSAFSLLIPFLHFYHSPEGFKLSSQALFRDSLWSIILILQINE